MEQQLPHWLSAAIDAAGITTVYNAEDWERLFAHAPVAEHNDPAANDPSAGPH